MIHAKKNLFKNEHIPIDVMISPEHLVTEHIQRVIEHPGAVQVVGFRRGQGSTGGRRGGK